VSAWTPRELGAIDASDELELASVMRDGTLRRTVTMWVVRHGDDLDVRSVDGRESSWFRGARNRHEARIAAGGVTKDVGLEETDAQNDAVDAAYRAKYRRYARRIVDRITSPEARAATLRLAPR
jgi:hypothetical protein